MIHDTLENSWLYEPLHPHFRLAFDHLKATDFAQMQPGEYSLVDGVRVIVSDTEGKRRDESQVEAHERFIDIQMPVSCAETMGWIARQNLTAESVPYNKEKDIAFFADEATDFVSVRPFEFVIFFPIDGHQPCLLQGSVRKVIVKVRV